jgi:hypothetical protein
MASFSASRSSRFCLSVASASTALADFSAAVAAFSAAAAAAVTAVALSAARASLVEGEPLLVSWFINAAFLTGGLSQNEIEVGLSYKPMSAKKAPRRLNCQSQ